MNEEAKVGLLHFAEYILQCVGNLCYSGGIIF